MKKIVISNADAVYLRERAEASEKAFSKWQVIKVKIDLLNDKLRILRQQEDEPFISAFADEEYYLEGMRQFQSERHQYAIEERRALIALRNRVLEILPRELIEQTAKS